MTPDTLLAGEITLRPWRLEEGHVYAGLRDELVYRFTTEDPSVDGESCASEILAARHGPAQVAFAICDSRGNPVGNVAVMRRNATAEISYWLSAPARGRGWASTALRAATAWAFEEWDVDNAELEIDPANEASVRVAEAAGYLRHGTRLQSACGGPALLYRLSAKT